MIEGLKATVTGTELLPLINAQVEFHTKRAEFYAAEAKRMADLGAAVENAIANKYSSMRDPREQLEGKAKEHRNAGARLAFIGKYLDVSEVYRLSDIDLHSLGVLLH